MNLDHLKELNILLIILNIMNNLSPITRAFLTVGIGVFIGIIPVFMIINSLSSTAIKFCGRYGSDYTIVDLDTPFGTIKRCVAKN